MKVPQKKDDPKNAAAEAERPEVPLKELFARVEMNVAKSVELVKASRRLAEEIHDGREALKKSRQKPDFFGDNER